MAVAELERLIGPPNVFVPEIDWGPVEQALECGLPSDYKALANRYSSLEFDDFLSVPNMALTSASQIREMKMRQLRGLEEGPGGVKRAFVYYLDGREQRNLPSYPHYPTEGGLLEWGNTTNGDHCLWRTVGDPDEWTVVVTDDGVYWFEYPGGMSAFLIGWLNHAFDTRVLSEEFPDAPAIRELVIETGEYVPTPRWREYFDSLELLIQHSTASPSLYGCG